MEDKRTLGKIYGESIREFAELNLELIKRYKGEHAIQNIAPEMIKEIRENAQALRILINVKED